MYVSGLDEGVLGFQSRFWSFSDYDELVSPKQSATTTIPVHILARTVAEAAKMQQVFHVICFVRFCVVVQ